MDTESVVAKWMALQKIIGKKKSETREGGIPKSQAPLRKLKQPSRTCNFFWYSGTLAVTSSQNPSLLPEPGFCGHFLLPWR